jgi:hypothetical protein
MPRIKRDPDSPDEDAEEVEGEPEVRESLGSSSALCLTVKGCNKRQETTIRREGYGSRKQSKCLLGVMIK